MLIVAVFGFSAIFLTIPVFSQEFAEIGVIGPGTDSDTSSDSNTPSGVTSTVKSDTKNTAKNNTKTDVESEIPPGMELKKVGGINLMVPEGAKLYKRGAVTVMEGASAYSARRLNDIESRLDKVEENIKELDKKVSAL